MSTSIKFHVGNRKKDGLAKLYIILIHNRKIARIPVKGILLAPSDFNGVVKTSARSVEDPAQVNSWLHDLQSKAYKIINKYAQDGSLDSLDVAKLQNLIASELFGDLPSKKTITFDSYTEGLIEKLTLARHEGNAAVYKQALQFMKKRAGENLRFADITFELLSSIEAKYFSEGNSANGLGTRMRTVRSIFNRALKEKIINSDTYPFLDYHIPAEPTVKRAITLEDIRLLNEYQPPKDSELFHARNYFMFSFHMRGMNFADLAQLRVSDIQDNRITFRRQKTGKLFNMLILPEIAEILASYLPGKVKNEFIFPIITRNDAHGQWLDIRNANKSVNSLLKDIAENVKLKKKLTTYVARHTWATIAKRANIKTAIISEGMGHSTEKTTQIYLDSFENKSLDDASKSISGLLKNKKKKKP